MELEKQVITLEQAKRLKELGVESDSLFYWKQNSRKKWYVGYTSMQNTYITDKPIYSAYTVAELGVMLPEKLSTYNYTNFGTVNCWTNEDDDYNRINKDFIDDTEAKVRAAILIYLLENGHTTAEEVSQRLLNN